MGDWFSTPGGVMRRLEPRGDGHWYRDREQRSHWYADSAVRRTRPPTWARLEARGEALLRVRRPARRA